MSHWVGDRVIIGQALFLLDQKRPVLVLGVRELVVAPDMRSLRRPKQTVHPARRRRMKDANVNQKPVLKIEASGQVQRSKIATTTNLDQFWCGHR